MKRAKRVPPPRLLVSIEDAGKMLSIGRTKVTELITAKTLPTVRIGRSVRIPLAALEKWVEQRTSA